MSAISQGLAKGGYLSSTGPGLLGLIRAPPPTGEGLCSCESVQIQGEVPVIFQNLR